MTTIQSSPPKPTVSVIIPAYNEEKYLHHCLSSLTQQNFAPPFEIIVVDNNSTDSTPRIALKYHAKLLHEPKQGVNYAKNTGCTNAQAQIVAVLDADNVAPPDWLSTIVSALNHPHVALVTGPYQIPDRSPIWAKLVTRIMIATEAAFQTLTGNTIHVWGGNLAFRKSDFDRIGGYDLDYGYGADEAKLRHDFLPLGRILLVPKMKVVTSSRRFKPGPYHFFVEFGLKHYFGNMFTRKLFHKPASDPLAVREEC